jgi:hypothetical protein
MKKLIALNVIFCFVPAVCLANCPTSGMVFEQDGVEAVIYCDGIEVYKDGAFLGELSITENGTEFNLSPQGLDFFLCLYLFGDGLAAFLVCLVPGGFIYCLIGIFNLMLIAACAS